MIALVTIPRHARSSAGASFAALPIAICIGRMSPSINCWVVAASLYAGPCAKARPASRNTLKTRIDTSPYLSVELLLLSANSTTREVTRERDLDLTGGGAETAKGPLGGHGM